MSYPVKATATSFKGVVYRSRLEARMAALLYAAGLPFEYEHRWYELGAHRHLPDFWLPTQELFVETKGVYDEAAAVRATDLARTTGRPVVIIEPASLTQGRWVRPSIEPGLHVGALGSATLVRIAEDWKEICAEWRQGAAEPWGPRCETYSDDYGPPWVGNGFSGSTCGRPAVDVADDGVFGGNEEAWLCETHLKRLEIAEGWRKRGWAAPELQAYARAFGHIGDIPRDWDGT